MSKGCLLGTGKKKQTKQKQKQKQKNFFFTCGFSIFVQVPPGLPGPPGPGLQVSQTPVVSPDGSHGFKSSFAS